MKKAIADQAFLEQWLMEVRRKTGTAHIPVEGKHPLKNRFWN
jgi:hypothetical protein